MTSDGWQEYSSRVETVVREEYTSLASSGEGDRGGCIYGKSEQHVTPQCCLACLDQSADSNVDNKGLEKIRSGRSAEYRWAK
jgi:hypothetical protein